MREFTVKQGIRGFVVVIGCQVAGFSTKEDLANAVQEYILDPEKAEAEYRQKDSKRAESLGGIINFIQTAQSQERDKLDREQLSRRKEEV